MMRLVIFVACFIIPLCTPQDPIQNGRVIKFLFVHERSQEYALKWLKDSLDNAKDNATYVGFDFFPVALETNDTKNVINVCEGFKQEIGLILDTSFGYDNKIKNLASSFGLPYVKLDIGITPALTLLDKYLDLRNSTDVAIIFENANQVDEALIKWIDSTRLRLLITDNLDDVTARRFKTMKPTPSNFAITSSTSNMETMFRNVQTKTMIKLPERWILLFLDFEWKKFDISLAKGQPINILSLDSRMCCTFLEKSNCVCPENFNLQEQFFKATLTELLKVINNLKDQHSFATRIACNDSTLSYDNTTKDSFDGVVKSLFPKKAGLSIDDDAISLKLTGNMDVVLSNGDLSRIATYSDESGIKVVSKIDIKPITPFFRVGMTHSVPWSFKVENPSDKKSKWTGYCVDFLQKLSEVMGFDYEIVEPKNGTFGKKYRNGYWDGVIGDLARGETDIGLTALTMTADREEVVDFVAPYFEQSGITIVMRKPVRKTSLFKFMTVLKLEVWMSIIAALVVTGIMIWFLDRYSPYSSRNNRKAYPFPCREFTLKESFWFALTSFTPQGGGEAPKALSGRTLVAAYWLFVVLMLATFTANLAAFLTVERMQTPVQSLEQLAKQSRINYTVVMDSDTHHYFINMQKAEDTLYRLWKELTLNASTDDTQYRVWDYPVREQYGHILIAINDSMPVKDARAGFDKVDERLDADFAFIHDSSEIKYEISRNCNLTQVGGVFAEKPYAVAVQQGSHLQDAISRRILELQKDRFFEHLQAKYWNNSVRGDCQNTDDSEGITLESLGGVFIATLFGLALAMITLVGEVLYYKKKNRKIAAKKGDNASKIQVIGKTTPTLTFGDNFVPTKKLIMLGKPRNDLYPKARNTIPRIN